MPALMICQLQKQKENSSKYNHGLSRKFTRLESPAARSKETVT